MLVELGHFALMLALMVALIQGVLPLLGTLGAGRLPWIPLSLRWGWLHMARASTFLQWALVSFAFFALEWAFLHNDFSVAYVVEHSNSLLPRPTNSPPFGVGMKARCSCGCSCSDFGPVRWRFSRAPCPCPWWPVSWGSWA